MSTPEPPSSGPLQDGGGCLTAAGLLALRSAVAGQAPPALAAHLAGCPRCMVRALAVDAPRPRSGRRPSVVAPSLGRSLLLAALVLGAIVAALVTLRRLAG
jgi:hypothetical protein